MKNDEAVLCLQVSRGLVVWAALVLALVLGVAAASAVFAQDEQTINGCVNKKTGALKVLKAGSACTSKETAISWNQAGPKGDPGEPGRPGEQGPAGPDGGDAGTLDGKDSTEFLGVRQKAVDAGMLDGKDSAEFAPDTDQDGKADAAESADQATNADSAADADKLDGKDSADFAAADHGHTTVVRRHQKTVSPFGFEPQFYKMCQPDETATGWGGGFTEPGHQVMLHADGVVGNPYGGTVYDHSWAGGEIHSYPMRWHEGFSVPAADGKTPQGWGLAVFNEANVSRTVEVWVVCQS